MERRALYHSLRIDPVPGAKSWQVEDYRKVSSDELFQRLTALGIPVDHGQFVALSEAVDTPEDFAETLLPDIIEDQEIADQIYLIVFELWRRFLSERQTLTTFCDEWDHQIDLYEEGGIESLEGIGDATNRFIALLEEAKDAGEDPKILYDSVVEGCAHDLEAFFYDFAVDQIEQHNTPYAEEIVEFFFPYVKDKDWFSLLNVQVALENDPAEALPLIQPLLKKTNDLEFNLEFLSILAKGHHEKAFSQVLKAVASASLEEEDFWDLLSSAEKYFHFQDADSKEYSVQEIIKRRLKNKPHLRSIRKILILNFF